MQVVGQQVDSPAARQEIRKEVYTGFELEEDDEACTSIKKANRVHGESGVRQASKRTRVEVPLTLMISNG